MENVTQNLFGHCRKDLSADKGVSLIKSKFRYATGYGITIDCKLAYDEHTSWEWVKSSQKLSSLARIFYFMKTV